MKSAMRGYAFGGMGSWNDVNFADAEVTGRYIEVSERLYVAIMGAMAAAIDAFSPNAS